MKKLVKVRLRNGRFEPVEAIDLEDGVEGIVVVDAHSAGDLVRAATGAWKNLPGIEDLAERIRRWREEGTRPD